MASIKLYRNTIHLFDRLYEPDKLEFAKALSFSPQLANYSTDSSRCKHEISSHPLFSIPSTTSTAASANYLGASSVVLTSLQCTWRYASIVAGSVKWPLVWSA